MAPANLRLIAAYYYTHYTTIECFSSSLTSKTKLKGVLEILASASEYEQQLTVRPGEEDLIRRLINHQRFSFANSKIIGPSEKTNALLQAHFSRQAIGGDLLTDQKVVVLKYAKRLVKAMVDVISSNGWLSLSLLAMEMNQMLARGMWERDSVFLQLPHFMKELAMSCQEKNIESIFDLLEMEDDERRELLQMSDSEVMDVARFCNSYPSVDLSYDVVSGDHVAYGENIRMEVSLEWDVRGRGEVEEGEG